MGVSLYKLFKFMGIEERNRIGTDLMAHNFLTWDPIEVYIQGRILKTYRDFFYETGRFSGNSTIVSVPRAQIPRFIESRDALSPLALYDTYAGRDMKGVVSVQFLAALNTFLWGDCKQSRDAMCELFHNLSWQALTNDNDKHQIQFGHVSILVQSINQRIQKHILEHRKKTADINFKIVSQLNDKQVVNEESQSEIDKIEQKIIDDNKRKRNCLWRTFATSNY